MLNTNTGETKMKAEMQNQNYQFRLVNAVVECEIDYPHIFSAWCHKTYRYIVMKQVAERYKVTIKDLKNLSKQSLLFNKRLEKEWA
tara:strand:+ start:147 stop:404 length:258 start_codon:yes stop_codon:yes gene_type:complete